VTGSSSGIGQATIVALARAEAAKLVIHYRSNEKGALATAQMARDAGCAEVFIVQADLELRSQRERLIAEAFDKTGSVDVWVNNAGADVLTGDAAKMDFSTKLNHLWQVDVAATIDLSRQLAARLKAQQSALPPSITFIGWDQAPQGMEGDAGQMFGPIKAAVMAFANSLAQELAPQVRVNTVAPGWIQTNWGKSTSQYWDQRAQAQSLMRRWGEPADVAKAILYVADPSNTFTTGQTIEINGGWDRKYPS
jgi:3-oxoacyl-[acyl-carrier protein] reductase